MAKKEAGAITKACRMSSHLIRNAYFIHGEATHRKEEENMKTRIKQGLGKPRAGKRQRPVWIALILAFTILVLDIPAKAGPKAHLWSKWQSHHPESVTPIDHTPWDDFLKAHVNDAHPSGIHRVRYASVTAHDRKALENYIEAMQAVAVSTYNRIEQKAFWVNLYNALTVKIILDHYPVKGIRDIDISPGWFSDGPWGAKLLKIEGEDVSLDDIEHRILRPIWKDNRIHYAVNCASLGCPNLLKEAFTASNTERLLEQGARAYINHHRGVKVEQNGVTLSSIYKWFQEDFGQSEKEVISHLMNYATPSLAESLKGFKGKISYDYDWKLNE